MVTSAWVSLPDSSWLANLDSKMERMAEGATTVQEQHLPRNRLTLLIFLRERELCVCWFLKRLVTWSWLLPFCWQLRQIVWQLRLLVDDKHW